MEILTEKLRECRTDYAGAIMPDRAEPIGCDCGLLREAEDEIERLHAELRKWKAWGEAETSHYPTSDERR